MFLLLAKRCFVCESAPNGRLLKKFRARTFVLYGRLSLGHKINSGLLGNLNEGRSEIYDAPQHFRVF